MPSQQSFGRDDGGDFRQKSSAKPLALAANRRRWSSLNLSRRPPSCLAKNPVLFAKVLDHFLLLLVHPPGKGDQYEPERMDDSWHLLSPLSRARRWGAEALKFQVDPVFGP